MLNVFQLPSQGATDSTAFVPAGSRLRVYVLLTDIAATLGAVQTAANYAADLQETIEIIAPNVVPFPLPLGKPPVHPLIRKRMLLAAFAGISSSVTVRIVLCRDKIEGLRSVIPRGSIVVIGLAGRWVRWREFILARTLRRMGYETVLSAH